MATPGFNDPYPNSQDTYPTAMRKFAYLWGQWMAGTISPPIAGGGGGGGDMLAATYDPAGVSQQLLGIDATQTMLNKTFNLAGNTLTGTFAEFNTACSDDNFAFLGQNNHFTGKIGIGIAPSAFGLDISGNTGATARFFDQTAVTGDTRVLIQAGAGQVSYLLRCINSAAAGVFAVQNSGNIEMGGIILTGDGGGNITVIGGTDIRASGFAEFTITGAQVTTAASTTTRAGLRLPSGVAPTTPVNGDIWFDGSNYKGRIGGVTVTFTTP